MRGVPSIAVQVRVVLDEHDSDRVCAFVGRSCAQRRKTAVRGALYILLWRRVWHACTWRCVKRRSHQGCGGGGWSLATSAENKLITNAIVVMSVCAKQSRQHKHANSRHGVNTIQCIKDTTDGCVVAFTLTFRRCTPVAGGAQRPPSIFCFHLQSE
jgi:hypothetical protein